MWFFSLFVVWNQRRTHSFCCRELGNFELKPWSLRQAMVLCLKDYFYLALFRLQKSLASGNIRIQIVYQIFLANLRELFKFLFESLSVLSCHVFLIINLDKLLGCHTRVVAGDCFLLRALASRLVSWPDLSFRRQICRLSKVRYLNFLSFRTAFPNCIIVGKLIITWSERLAIDCWDRISVLVINMLMIALYGGTW